MLSSYLPPPEVVPCRKCQVCRSPLPDAVLDLGLQPLCDDLVPIGDSRVTVKYPIQISLCQRCLTAHQCYNIRKETLFSKEYHYRPRFTQDVLQGMKHLVDECAHEFGDLKGMLVCDIGCNDGSLLNFFREAGAKTCGIEPTGAGIEAATAGHAIINDYFTRESAEQLPTKSGRPDVITFTNVFAHIEDLTEAIAALRILITDKTLIVIENHYLGTVLATNQFDTFYHEHPRTYSLKSFQFVAQGLGGEVLLATFPKRYGGNIRVFIGGFHGSRKKARSEIHLTTPGDESRSAEKLAQMQDFVIDWKTKATDQIACLRRIGVKLYGKSFPGRAAILVALLGIDREDQPCVYEKPGSLKIGHYLPGTRIEILSDDRWISNEDRPAAMLIWGWHIAPEIAGYMRGRGYKGRIFTPLPEFKELP